MLAWLKGGKNKPKEGSGRIPLGKGEFLDPSVVFTATAAEQEITPERLASLVETGEAESPARSGGKGKGAPN